MSARDQRNLLLEYKSGIDVGRRFILANIAGYRYVFGTRYAGAVEGEDFLFCRSSYYDAGLVSPAHCTITVDEVGQYWISNYTPAPNFYETFVNSERVEGAESRLLKLGDVITLGNRGSGWNPNPPPSCSDKEKRRKAFFGRKGCAGPGPPPRYPIYLVKERVATPMTTPTPTPTPGRRRGSSEEEIGERLELEDGAESPLENGLILSKILGFLSFQELKTARQVCKGWGIEATPILGKRGVATFHFGEGYASPTHSTRVARYLHDLRAGQLQPRTLQVTLEDRGSRQELLFSAGEPGEKLMDDVRKILTAPNCFDSLIVRGNIRGELFPPLALLLWELGGRLLELKLEGGLVSVPTPFPPLPLLSNLRTLQVYHWTSGLRDDLAPVTTTFLSHIVPILSSSLETFICRDRSGDAWLQAFLDLGILGGVAVPRLRGVSLQGQVGEDALALLLQLSPNRLNFLTINASFMSEPNREVWATLLQRVLQRNSRSLTRLHLHVTVTPGGEVEGGLRVNFPPALPNLADLELRSEGGAVQVLFGGRSSLDYVERFPALRSLVAVGEDVWGAFFGGGVLLGAEAVGTVTASLPEPDAAANGDRLRGRRGPARWWETEAAAQPRLQRVRALFPRAQILFVRAN